LETQCFRTVIILNCAIKNLNNLKEKQIAQ